jgi:hypothetical protein
MSSRLKRVLVPLVVVVIAATSSLLGGVSPVHAQGIQLPYQDPGAQGDIGFCDAAGHPITKGNIHDVPFVPYATAHFPTPQGFRAPGRTAVMWAFTPTMFLTPSDWPSKRMTFSTRYSDLEHPTVEATFRDPALDNITTLAPPMVDGLIQLRLFFSAQGAGVENTRYPAAAVKVTGDNWTLVAGDFHPDCKQSQVMSLEHLGVVGKTLPTAPPTYAANHSGKPTAPPTPSSSGQPVGSPTPSGSPSEVDPSSTVSSMNASAQAASSDEPLNADGGSPVALFVAGGALVLGLGLLAGYLMSRRRA